MPVPIFSSSAGNAYLLPFPPVHRGHHRLADPPPARRRPTASWPPLRIDSSFGDGNSLVGGAVPQDGARLMAKVTVEHRPQPPASSLPLCLLKSHRSSTIQRKHRPMREAHRRSSPPSPLRPSEARRRSAASISSTVFQPRPCLGRLASLDRSVVSFAASASAIS